MITRRKFTGTLAAAFAVVASGTVFATIPGCGDDASVEPKPPEEQHKDSMDYMQQKYSSKKGKK